MSPLRVGDKVRTATALNASHWTQNQLACRQPGAEGTVVRVASPAELYASCGECHNQGRYIVEHNLGNCAHYHGDELTLATPIRRKGEPEPDDEPDGGRIGERVEAVESALQKLRRQLMIDGIECFRFDLPAIAKAASHAEKAFTSEKPPTPWQRLRTDVRTLRDGLILAQETLGLCEGDGPGTPRGGGLLGRVEALTAGVERLEGQLRGINERLGATGQTGLSGQLDALRGRVAALEQPSAPEPADHSADDALAKARPWCECTWIARDSVTSWLVDNGQQRSAPEQWIQDEAAAALEAVPDLVRALDELPPPDAADRWWCDVLADALQVPAADSDELLHRLRAQLEAYRALHRAAVPWNHAAHIAALRTLRELGVTPDKPPAAVHDDSSLDLPRPVTHCERCGGRPEQHPGEPTCAELRRLWLPLIGPDRYDYTDPETLAAAILSDHADADELSGIHQQLLEAVDGEPEAATEELLASVLRRVKPVQYLIKTREAEDMKGAAAGLEKLCHSGSLGRCISGLLRKAAAIAEEEQD